jgi:hypothetical protein
MKRTATAGIGSNLTVRIGKILEKKRCVQAQWNEYLKEEQFGGVNRFGKQKQPSSICWAEVIICKKQNS